MFALHRCNAVRTLALLGLCSWLVGCTSWVAMDQPYAESITEERPSAVRVTLDDGSRREVSLPVVSGDTIYDSNIRASYPIDHVAGVEAAHTSALATVGLVLGVVVIGLFVAGAVACSGGDTMC